MKRFLPQPVYTKDETVISGVVELLEVRLDNQFTTGVAVTVKTKDNVKAEICAGLLHTLPENRKKIITNKK